MTKLKKFNFALVLLVVAIYGGYSLRLHELLLNRDLVLVGGDLSWNIFAIKIGMQGNLDGISEILGWPYGYGLFAEPLLGTGPFYAAMLISKILFPAPKNCLPFFPFACETKFDDGLGKKGNQTRFFSQSPTKSIFAFK